MNGIAFKDDAMRFTTNGMAAKRDEIRHLRDEASQLVADGKLKKAAEVYRRLIQLEPSSGDWARRGAECFRQLGRTDKQLELLLHAARAYQDEGQLLKAIAMAKMAQRISPEDSTVAAVMEQLSSASEQGVRPLEQFQKLPRHWQHEGGAPWSPASPSSVGQNALTAGADPKRQHEGGAPWSPASSSMGQSAPTAGADPEGSVVIDMEEFSPEEPPISLAEEDLVSLRQPETPEKPKQPSRQQHSDETGPLDRSGAPSSKDPNKQGSAKEETALEALGSTELFRELSGTQLRGLVRVAALVELASGQVLFSQGDLADAMYVVVLGEVAALAGERKEPIELARLGPGQFFGEIGLLGAQPRQATIRAREDAVLLRFGREPIAGLMSEDPRFQQSLHRFLRLRLVEALMLTSSLFAPFGAGDRATLQRLFRFLDVPEGTRVVTEGQKSDGLYVLVTGEAAVIRGTGEDEMLLGLLGSGDVFGEMSLLNQEPAVASVVLRSRSFLLRLPDRYWMEVLMMHPALMEHVATLGATRKEQNAALLRDAGDLQDGHVVLL